MEVTKDIQLKLTIDEANLILESLGTQPFVKVHQLIHKIQQQAESQLNKSEEKQPLHPKVKNRT